MGEETRRGEEKGEARARVEKGAHGARETETQRQGEGGWWWETDNREAPGAATSTPLLAAQRSPEPFRD